jgi:hypothetical protein
VKSHLAAEHDREHGLGGNARDPFMGLRMARRVPGYFAGMLLFQMSR